MNNLHPLVKINNCLLKWITTLKNSNKEKLEYYLIYNKILEIP
jgi:hypothetical protein